MLSKAMNDSKSGEKASEPASSVSTTGTAAIIPVLTTLPSTDSGIHVNDINDTSTPQPHQDAYEPLDDHDSAYGDSFDDSASSIDSAITKYRFENGRRYHAYRDGAYWGPNDEVHNDQQDMAHHLWLLTLDNKLFLAPLENPHSILDVGTGTGIWAIDMADTFPSAVVTGVDLSAIQPKWVPPNCIFEIDDVNLEWTFPPQTFDFIHIRELFGSINNWHELFGQAYGALKPGGYLECAEHSATPTSDDGTVGPEHVFTKYGNTVEALCRKRGRELEVYKTLKETMEGAGFVDVVEFRSRWPMNGCSRDPKQKELGRWNHLRVNQGIEGFAMRTLTAVGGWDPMEVQVFAAQIRAALKDKKVHGYLEVAVVYGRKPDGPEVES